MSEVHATFSLTKAELVQAQRAVRRNQRDTRALYMFLGLAALLAVGSSLVGREGPRYGLLALELAFFAAVALAIWLFPWFQVHQSKTLAQALAPQSWRLASGGADVKTELATTSFAWATVLRAVEDADYFLLFVSEALAYPIPKRALSPEQRATLRSGLRAWLMGRAQVQS